ncbi:MAG: phosphoenolpyruvate-protein phosphotransferase [Pseudomonadota bacterium]|jgi:phosphotransferase system enzyme I (PtsI)
MARHDRTPPPATPGQERVLRAMGISPGIAIGPAHVVEAGAVQVPELTLAEDALPAELERFRTAVEKARRQVRKLKAKAAGLPESAAEDVGFLLDAHLAMLTGSRLIRGVERRITGERINAEAAVQAEIATIAQSFAAMDDSYLAARVDDVREVGRRLIRNLLERPYQAFSQLLEGTIVLAEELTPADTALLDPRRIGGFATVLGGAEGHTAIMARALGLPAVLGAAGLLQGVQSGDLVVVDGIAGRVHLNPPPPVLEDYRHRRADWLAERKRLEALRSLPGITRDGEPISLQANLELPREVEGALEAGAEGVGLLRTEFLYMNRDDLPDEEEQYQILRALVERMDGRPVTARTLDIGGEKLASALNNRFNEPANPALGLRAIRLGLLEPRLLETQIAAMLRAAAHGPLRILLPMICSVGEVRQVREMVARVARRLRRRGDRIANPLPPLGIMIEVPGAALSADALAPMVDFFAIGTNDLIQYTLAIDRGDEQVAHLYDPLHPAVLRLVQFTVAAARRHDIPVSVCGEMAGDPRYAALLLGLGVRDLSMAPGNLPRVKRRVRSLDLREAARRADAIMGQFDSGRIAALLDDFNGLSA